MGGGQFCRREWCRSTVATGFGCLLLFLWVVGPFCRASLAEDPRALDVGYRLNPGKTKESAKGDLPAAVALLAETAGGPARELVFSTGPMKRVKSKGPHEKVFQLARGLQSKPVGGGAGESLPVCEECLVNEFSCGATGSGRLLPSDCVISDESFVDLWAFEVIGSSQTITVTLQSEAFDTFLFVFPSDCDEPLGTNDDCVPGYLSRSCVTLDLTPGSYFVGANSFDARQQGDYELTIECTDFSLCRDCVSDDIVCGRNFSSALTPESCVETNRKALIDLWRFEVETLSSVSFRVLSQQFDSVTLVLDSNCQIIAENDDCRRTEFDSCPPLLLDPGTYFLGVRSFDAGMTGDYDVVFDCVDLGVCNDCRSGAIVCGSTMTGSLGPDSCTDSSGTATDVWILDVESSVTKLVDVALHGEGTRFEFLDGFCQPIAGGAACPEGSGSCRSLALDAGRYFVKVTKSTAGRAAYSLNLTCGDFDPVVDCVVGSLQCGGTVTEQLEPTDCRFPARPSIDVWEFELETAQLVDLRMSSTTLDTTIVVIGDTVEIFFVNDDCSDGDTNSCLTVPLSAGKYHVQATSFATGEIGEYTLGVSCAESALCSDCSVGAVSCNDVVEATLGQTSCSADFGFAFDVWQVELPVAGRLSVSARSEQLDPILTLLDSECGTRAQNDDCEPGITNACLDGMFEAGTYHIGVTHFDPGVTGTYQMQVECPDVLSCTTCDRRPLRCDETASGELSPDDCRRPGGTRSDLWSFDVPQEMTVSISLRSKGFDPSLEILTEECQELVSNDDCGADLNSCLSLVVPPGRLLISVGSIFPEMTGGYQLRLDCVGGNGGQRPGDSNQDGKLDVSDSLSLLRGIFLGDAPPLPCGDGKPSHPANRQLLDLDGNGSIGLGDAVVILDFLFNGSATPIQGHGCRIIEGCPESCLR